MLFIFDFKYGIILGITCVTFWERPRLENIVFQLPIIGYVGRCDGHVRLSGTRTPAICGESNLDMAEIKQFDTIQCQSYS
jgi:hypothetical protein